MEINFKTNYAIYFGVYTAFYMKWGITALLEAGAYIA